MEMQSDRETQRGLDGKETRSGDRGEKGRRLKEELWKGEEGKGRNWEEYREENHNGEER